MTLMTQAQFAAHRGVGKSAVSNWKRAGLLIFGESGDSGRQLVHVERTDARLNARVDPTRGRPTAAMNAGDDLLSAVVTPERDDGEQEGRGGVASVRADVAREDLVAKRLKNAEAARELVPAIEAERRLAAIGAMARERVMAELRARGERLAAETTQRGAIVLCQEAVTVAFTALADAIEGGALDADDGGDDAIDAEAA